MHRRLLFYARSAGRKTTPVNGTSRRMAPRLVLVSRKVSTHNESPASKTAKSSPPTDAPPDLSHVDLSPQAKFAAPTVAAFALVPRIVKYSLSALAAIVGLSLLALEGTHFYVEHVALAPSKDPSGFDWGREQERWTGGPEKGGTDPALGWKARHALRAAWVALHWGTGVNVLRSNSPEYAQRSAESGAVEAPLEYALDFLTLALALAKERDGLRPETTREILAMHAGVLERIGSVGALWDARAEYEKVWEWLEESGNRSDVGREEAARLALKLGDVNARLGDGVEAQLWWSRTNASFAKDALFPFTAKVESTSWLSEKAPDSPYSQRTFAALLTSVSAHYARSGQLVEAQNIQEGGISDLKELQRVFDRTHTSSGQLHRLYIAQRVALLSLHRAQVLHALQPVSGGPSGSDPNAETLESLEDAGRASEDVVRGLCSSSSDKNVSVNTAKVTPCFADEKVLSKHSQSLLRDARRTAIGAWVMAAGEYERASVLSLTTASVEKSVAQSQSKSWFSSTPPSQTTTNINVKDVENRKVALACYERALALAGISAASLEASASAVSGQRREKELQMLASEYDALVKGYERVRDAVLRDAMGSQKAS